MTVKTFRILLISMVFLALGAVSVSAQQDREADHEALRVLRNTMMTAIENQDVHALASCFSRDFVFITSTQDALTSQADIQAFMDRMFHGEKALVEGVESHAEADILTRFLGEDVGICYGKSEDVYTMKSGSIVRMKLRWSATVLREDGEWKVAVAHVGADFLDNPVLDEVLNSSRRMGFAEGLVGLFIGAFIGWFFGRRKGRDAKS